jgi:hypothetical protein
MIVIPAGVKVHLALGHTDMCKGLDGLSHPLICWLGVPANKKI